MIHTMFQVALGGAIGATGRYLAGMAALRLMGPGFPWGTLVVNVLGSFVMGLLVVAMAHWGSNRMAPFLMTGILGGFTTFSTFSLDTLTLWQRGDILAATAYVGGSLVLSLSAIVAGVALARSLT